jgi:hypothetical protein
VKPLSDATLAVVFASLSVVGSLVGCASTPPASAPSTTAAVAQAADVAPAQTPSADPKAALEAAPRASAPGESFDPLAEGAAFEAANIPKVEATDKKLLTAKSRQDLDAAFTAAQAASSVDEAVTKLTTRLGKATWVENGTKRIWVAVDGPRCHRLILEGDGSLHVETLAKTDVVRLTATVRQDPCTGAIERGGLN